MTTIRQIVTDAFREGGIIQIGTTPEAEQLDEGVRKLQSIILQLLGNAAGEGFVTVSYGEAGDVNNYGRDTDRRDFIDSYYVPSNLRLAVNSSSAQTVYLDPNPQPGARLAVHDVLGTFGTSSFTIKANGRKIDGSDELVLSTNGENGQWFYRDDLSEWVRVTDIEPSDESPFPREFDELLITTLAMRMNPRYQQQTAPETIQAYREIKSQFRARYRQSEFSPSDVSRLYWNGLHVINPTTAFNRGLVA
jgi:hypothetical protein